MESLFILFKLFFRVFSITTVDNKLKFIDMVYAIYLYLYLFFPQVMDQLLNNSLLATQPILLLIVLLLTPMLLAEIFDTLTPSLSLPHF